MNREKVSDLLDECSELVQTGKMQERLYLELCQQFGMRYREDAPQESDSDEDSDVDDAADEPDEMPAAPAAAPAAVVRNRTIDPEPVTAHFLHSHAFERAHTQWRTRTTTDEAVDLEPDYRCYRDQECFNRAFVFWQQRQRQAPAASARAAAWARRSEESQHMREAREHFAARMGEPAAVVADMNRHHLDSWRQASARSHVPPNERHLPDAPQPQPQQRRGYVPPHLRPRDENTEPDHLALNRLVEERRAGMNALYAELARHNLTQPDAFESRLEHNLGVARLMERTLRGHNYVSQGSNVANLPIQMQNMQWSGLTASGFEGIADDHEMVVEEDLNNLEECD